MTRTPARTLAAPLLVVGLAGLAGLAGCGSAPDTIGPTGVDELEIPTPSPDPDDFLERIDNELLPLVPGSVWKYRAVEDGEVERITVTVLEETRVVAGVTVTVVRDVVRDAEGKLVEDTHDWFAQDRDGNVWYFGEETTSYDEGKPSTEGSWEAGVDGAQAGLVMPAEPRVGDGYAQEYYPGEAEDQGEILDVDATVTIGYGDFDGVLQTADTNRLEPRVVEHKYYAPGIGLVYEETVAGGDETVELVRFTPGA